jgi:hypothetical protein
VDKAKGVAMPIVVENICKLDRLPVVEEASRARSEEIPVPMRNRRQSFSLASHKG